MFDAAYFVAFVSMLGTVREIAADTNMPSATRMQAEGILSDALTMIAGKFENASPPVAADMPGEFGEFWGGVQ